MNELIVLTLLALTLAQTQPSASVFDYDQEAPLGIEELSSKTVDGVRVSDITFESPRGGLVPAWIVEPVGEGPFGAIVFMHMGEADRNEFVEEPKIQAARGFVSILIDAPYLRPEPPPTIKDDKRARAENDLDIYTTLVIDLRRAIDVLVAKPNVDSSRIGYVGHSLGAAWGGALSGFERRLKAFVLIAGSGLPGRISGEDWYSKLMQTVVGDQPEQIQHYEQTIGQISPHLFVPDAIPGSILLQFALNDEKVSRDRAEQIIAVAGSSHEVRWYETDHDFEHKGAADDRVEWMSKRLER